MINMPSDIKNRANKKILIVDDEGEICELLRMFFRRKGFDAVCAYSADEGLRIVRSEGDVRLMILDMRMPGMPVEEMLTKLEENGGGPAVIILTGSVSVELGDFRRFSIVRDIELKPVDITILLDKVDNALGVDCHGAKI